MVVCLTNGKKPGKASEQDLKTCYNTSDQDFTAFIEEGCCWRPFWGFEVPSTVCHVNSIVTCNANWLLEVPKNVCTFPLAVLCAPQLCSLLYPGFIWVKFGNELGLSNYLHSREQQAQERCLNFWLSTKGSGIHEHLIRTSSTFWDDPWTRITSKTASY
jgi:hypothetical protein